MDFYSSLPLIFLKFWFLEAPKGLLKFFSSFNSAFNSMFSLTLLIRTYFKPWKNEYRQGLVGFSVAMSIFIKSAVILIDLILFISILTIELVLIISFLLWPIGLVILLFK